MAGQLTKIIPEHHLPVKYGGTSMVRQFFFFDTTSASCDIVGWVRTRTDKRWWMKVPFGQSPMGIALRSFVRDRLDETGLSMYQEITVLPPTSL